MFSLVLLLNATPSGAADRTPKAPDRAQTPPGNAPGTENYRIGVGDVLNIEVVGRRDLSAQYTVAQDGVLFMPLTGGVPAEGKTAVELSADLARRLSLYDRDITQVNVSIAEFKSRRINVLGAVIHPGKFSFAQLPNIWDAIGEAGGPTEDANLSAVEVVPSDQSGGQTPQVVDVAAAVREGRVRSLDHLKPGDTVRVPKALPGTMPSNGLTGGASSSIFVFGAINRPGPLPVGGQTDLMSAIAQSGGPSPDANLSAVQIVRRTGPRAVHMKVNLNSYIDKAMISGNPPLMAGDTVFLPRQGTKGFLAVIRTLSPVLALASTVILIFRR
ncbi:MAG TPA: polysaccharide biosynthesis/export family protein [Candidatus Binatia bacterium]|nr:polysaccharide biosynthesis/export family protein [Candidatus Binatia bacterium]